MASIVDTSVDCGPAAGELAKAGVETIARYYSRNTGLPAKQLTAAEAAQVAAAGLRLAVVHEARDGNQVTAFTEALGLEDGAYAAGYGANTIDQPAGSAIYFAVDFDATPDQVQASVIPYFKGVAQAMAQATRRYRVGVYGSGSTCNAVMGAGLADLAWLGQATGWSGYQTFRESNLWALLQQMPSEVVAGVACDPDTANPTIADFGSFALTAITAE